MAVAGILGLSMAYIVVPTALALAVRASLSSILIAYLLWGLMLFGWVSSQGGHGNEALGFAMIFGMFLTSVAIPILTLALRVVGLR